MARVIDEKIYADMKKEVEESDFIFDTFENSGRTYHRLRRKENNSAVFCSLDEKVTIAYAFYLLSMNNIGYTMRVWAK